MDDREAAAAIAAGDPAGIAAAYDMYGAALYGYCQWMLDRPGAAAEAVRDTFVVASAAIGDLADPAKLCPWLYSVARHECQRRLGATAPGDGGQIHADGRPPGEVGGPADLPDIRNDLTPAELVSLIRGILAELPPREREVIELSLRHNLHDDDLAEALGVSWSRAHSLTERARGRLEKALGTLLVARTGREYCPELGDLLTDWDGRLTESTRDLVAEHIEYCSACADRRRGSLRPAALSGLLPLAPLPPELRDQVLGLCSAATPAGAAHRQPGTRRAGRAGRAWLARVWQVITPTRSARIRANPGRATVGAVVVIWVVAAASMTMLTFGGSHPAGALAVRSSPSPSPSPSPAASTITAPVIAISSRSASHKPSPHPTHSRTFLPSPVESAPASVSPSPSRSAKPSRSPSPKPSKSPSPSASASKSPSPSPSASASPSPTKTG